MTKKKTAETIPKEESQEIASKKPLVFISHDTKDAAIAEAFSDLLSSVSAGVLKSFRSSDKKGNQGLEYGTTWYPVIMEKIEESTDVVCLLTHNSIDRPWILYEAGVSKGKLNTTVLGVALGIPLTTASNGPFGQFQNCDDDIDSLTKLVAQLLRRIPNSEPVEQVIKAQVTIFKGKCTELLSKVPKKDAGGKEKKELIEDTSVAKLFEEVKIMFESLPSRIEHRIEPDFKRRRRKFHPMMFEEMMHMGKAAGDSNLVFLMLVSIYKDDFPWFYEIGLETYRELKKTKIMSERRKLLESFERATEMLGHPMMREMYGKSDEMHFFLMESRHMVHNLIERLQHEKGWKE